MRVAIILLIFLVVHSVSAQGSRGDLLTRQVGDFTLTHKNSYNEISDIAVGAHVPLGFEFSVDREIAIPEGGQNICRKHAVVKDLLDAFVEINPGYQWSLGADFILIYPRSMADRDPILDVIISNVSLDKVERREAVRLLFKTPEMNAFMRREQLKPNSDITAFGQLVDEPEITLNAKNTSLRDFLNQVLQTGSVTYWSVFRTRDGSDIDIVLRR